MSVPRICRMFLLCCTLAGATFTALAQSADTAGLEVYVHDPSGALVPGATLVLVQTDTNVQRTVTTDAAGHVRFTDIPVGPYKLNISKPGFEDFEQTGLNLLVGTSPSLQIKMPLGSASQKVEVDADVPIVQTEGSTVGQNISASEIDNLPSDGRNFLNFALTVPGVSSQATSGQGSGLSFNGGRSRSNDLLIDGVENNGNINGTVRQSLSIDAIAQFQVMTAQFQPEYGNSGGGIVNILTKSGTNDIHGDAYYFARRQWMNAYPIIFGGQTPFNPIYVYNDVGGTLGGPIKKNKTFLFASAEYIGINTNQANETGPVRDAEINAQLLAHPLFGSTVMVNPNAYNVISASTTASVRIDHTFGPRDTLYYRFLYGQYNKANPAADQNDGIGSDVSNSGTDTNHAVGNTLVETHIFTPSVINEARFQYSPQFLTQHPNSIGPDVLITGTGQFGQNLLFPTVLNESHYEWYDALTVSHKNHLFKAGADVIFIHGFSTYYSNFQGYFNFEELSSTATVNHSFLGSTTDGQAPQPYIFEQAFGSPNIKLPDWLYAGFVEDTWKIKPRLTLNYGMRYDVDLQPQGYNNNPNNPIMVPLPKGIPRDYNNVSPRIGLAYAVDRASRTVIRAGYGFFYDKIFLLVARNALLPQETLVVEDATGSTSVQTLLRNIYSNGLTAIPGFTNLATYPTGVTGAFAPSITATPQKQPIPYSQEANLTLDHQFSANWQLELSYVHIDGSDALKTSNVNLLAPTIVTAANSLAIAGTATPSYQQLLRPFYPGTRINPAYRNIDEVGSWGHSRYDGFVSSVIHRATSKLTLRANWTWSKTIDDGSDFTLASSPENPLVPQAERSISTQDQRNAFTGSAVFAFPAPTGQQLWKAALLSNWRGAVIANVSSGTPVNTQVGVDVDDTTNINERPYYPGDQGVSQRRNDWRGPRQQNVSLRLQKVVPLRGSMRLQGSIESFNTFNHTNYNTLGIQNVWGTGALPQTGIYNQLPGHANVSPTSAYTYAFGAPESASDTRHLQLGIKFYF